MGKKFTQKPTKLQKITTAAVAALALGSGLSVAPVSATVRFEDSDFYTLDELFAAEATYNAEVAACQEAPHTEPTNCYEEAMSRHILSGDANDDIFKALHIFQIYPFSPLSFNPARNTIDIYYRDFDVVAAREGQDITRSLTSLTVTVPFVEGFFTMSTDNSIANQISTFYLDGFADLSDNWLGEVHFNLSTDGDYQIDDVPYHYTNCINSDTYKKGMRCDIIVSADGRSNYYPFGEPDPEPTNSDLNQGQNQGQDQNQNPDPDQNQDPAPTTDPDPNQNIDPSSDLDPNSTSDPFQDPTTQEPVNSNTGTDLENSSRNSNQPQLGSDDPEDNNSADPGATNATQLAVNDAKIASVKTSSPLAPNTGANTEEAGNDATADFPWWLVATLGLASFLAFWWILPASDRKKS